MGCLVWWWKFENSTACLGQCQWLWLIICLVGCDYYFLHMNRLTDSVWGLLLVCVPSLSVALVADFF